MEELQRLDMLEAAVDAGNELAEVFHMLNVNKVEAFPDLEERERGFLVQLRVDETNGGKKV
jgi:hypothetical protein